MQWFYSNRVRVLLGGIRPCQQVIQVQLHHPSGSVCHLGYCSNIHAGESWAEVYQNLNDHVPGIRNALNRPGDFGIGLRLSAAAVNDLSAPENMTEFKAFLNDKNCYVFTINGFPYGAFHGTRVKENVYLPDWQDTERLRYTNQLADVFAEFLPTTQNGSISTVPGAFKQRVTNRNSIESMAHNMVDHVAHLVRLEQRTGQCINLALEPEPCCFLETIDETVNFFRDCLFGQKSLLQLSNILGISQSEADTLLHKHLTVCLDICHAAVEFENAETCINALKQAGISIGKLQISSGLRLKNVTRQSAALLKPFNDSVYLHQVVERCNGQLKRFTDLPHALENLDDSSGHREWRVHFHVPIFLEQLEEFSSTQFFIRDVLALHNQSPISEHLEVETYTWDVLPPAYRTDSVDTAIVRELEWVIEQLDAVSGNST